ncbi:SUR7/PalI family-domain-containing protein [Lipomyces tetrasporus]|uniref:SUR7/PalI family-domain-containing protein n=1 Tax=Lipomyces tetrasporus TaxID=54092 RepID=A0AAD7VQ76_9ASCO|nr:SUR7/PalI family-domain-containing protein [Lipomyces tetrasporus]KAJ8098617.1 SUR7/PalI family-domain-containing protein [Lipomyces tetrasporus]
MAILPRAATPLCVLLTIAFGLQLVAVISVPIVESITLATYESVKFGVFGICTPEGCSAVRIGYPNSIVSGEGNDFSLPSNARHSLTNLLIVHPIAAGFTLILLVLSLIAHFHGPANSPRYLFFLLIFCLPTFILALLAFLVDILLFIPHLAWGGWIVLAATVIIAVCSLILCTMRRTLSSRKAMRKRIFESPEEGPNSMRLNQMPFYPPGTNPQAVGTYEVADHDREVLIYDDAEGKVAKPDSDEDEDSTLTRDNSGTLNGEPNAISDYDSPPHTRYDHTRANPRDGNGYRPPAAEYTRFNNSASPRPGPQQHRYDPRNGQAFDPYTAPSNYNHGPGSHGYPQPGVVTNPYSEYPRDKHLRTARPRTPRQRPAHPVVLPPAGSAIDRRPSEPDVIARSEPVANDVSPNGPDSGHVTGETTLHDSGEYPTAHEIPTAGTPVNGDVSTVGEDEQRNPFPRRTETPGITSVVNAEYVPPRQAWRDEDISGQDRMEEQEQPGRRRRNGNTSEYYDDVDPQYADEVVSSTNTAYTQTVSPISPTSSPSARGLYSEFLPPPRNASGQGYYQRQNPRVVMPSPQGPARNGSYVPRQAHPPEYRGQQQQQYAPAPPQSPDGSVVSNFTSVSQRGVNPRYYQQPPNVPLPQSRPDRSDVVLRGNPDFELAGVSAGRRGQRLPQAPTLMVGRQNDSPYAAVNSRSASSAHINGTE